MDLRSVRLAVTAGDAEAVARGVHALLAQGVSPVDILEEALMPGMKRVGDLFESGECFIPGMMTAARAMRRAMDILQPALVGADVNTTRGQVVLGTVKDDIHELGKNLVGMMLTGAGFEIQDLGVDVPVGAFVEAVANGADVLGISALISTTIPNIPLILDALIEEGLRDDVYVIIGGSPITQEFADSIGADGYAPDAVQAVDCVERLLGLK